MLVILGANGGIGSGLLDCAVSDGRYGKVRGVYRGDCDVTDSGSIERFFSTLEYEGPLYVVNATGHMTSATLLDGRESWLDESIAVNVKGNQLLTECFFAAVESRPGSSLLLLSSVVARLGVYGASAYGMTKAAISGLVRSASKEFASYSARINCIEMGYFDVGMISKIPDKHLGKIVMSIPQKRLGTVAELWTMCDAILRCGYMTGSTVTVSGGL